MAGFDNYAVSHTGETGMDWQYGTTSRLALTDEPHLTEKPPGDGWFCNAYRGDRGREVRTPAWSDGSVVLQFAYWRRPFPGMRSWDPRHLVRVNTRPWWVGSEIPAQILEERRAAAPVDNRSPGFEISGRLIVSSTPARGHRQV